MVKPRAKNTVLHLDLAAQPPAELLPVGQQSEGPGAHAHLHPFLSPVTLPFQLPTQVYGVMLAIWHLRPGLQKRFPLQKGTPREFLRYLAWCVFEGRREYETLRSIREWDQDLARPVELPVLRGDLWSGAFSIGMFLFGVARSHYAFGPLLTSAKTRHRIARLYWRGERHKRHMPPPADWQRELLERLFGSAGALVDAIRIPRREADAHPEVLRQQFDLADLFESCPPGKRAPGFHGRAPAGQHMRWVPLPKRLRRSPVRIPLRGLKSVAWAMDRFTPRPHEFQLAGITARVPVARRSLPRLRGPFGVNLVGYAKGELGIGEDVRMLAFALEANDVPFCIVDVELGAHVSQMDRSVERWVAEKPCYPINLFCMTGIEQARYACERGLDLFDGRYTIGLWPWELPEWPASCRYVYGLIDEIWGISEYAALAYRGAPCPVYPMSLPVVVEPIGPETRVEFGLPQDAYLFLFAFDYHSTLARKNPEGAVRAFQQAFPPRRLDRVGLVIKASHTERARGEEWDRLKALIRTDPRIYLIDTTLRRPSLLALYHCCDCFVSLHRAEGFGRSIAEAMLLGLPVVATGFSGNLDYCRAGPGVDLVPYKLREVRRHEYFWGEGQHWAEPDLHVAARLMRRRATEPRRPRGHINDLSPLTVGERYRRRLTQIFRDLYTT